MGVMTVSPGVGRVVVMMMGAMAIIVTTVAIVMYVMISAIIKANMLAIVLAGMGNVSLLGSVMRHTTFHGAVICSYYMIIAMGTTLISVMLPVLIFFMITVGLLVGDGGCRA